MSVIGLLRKTHGTICATHSFYAVNIALLIAILVLGFTRNPFFIVLEIIQLTLFAGEIIMNACLIMHNDDNIPRHIPICSFWFDIVLWVVSTGLTVHFLIDERNRRYRVESPALWLELDDILLLVRFAVQVIRLVKTMKQFAKHEEIGAVNFDRMSSSTDIRYPSAPSEI